MRDSPAVHRGDLRRTFQQFTLALNVSECILFLQRPYFVKALQEAPQDPTRSTYGRSYLAVVERCNVLIEVVAGLYDLYPTVTARHWFFWYHLFTAAVCVGTMIIKNAANPLADFALGQIDHSIRLYSAVLRDHATPSLLQNHQWLLRLRQRALHKIEHEAQARRRGRRRRARRRAGSNESGDDADADGDADVDAEADDADDGVSEGGSDGADDDADEDDRIDIELLGWRTRLVERARPAPSPVLVPPLSKSPAGTAPAAPIEQVLQQHFAVPPVGGSRPSMELSTDLFVSRTKMGA
jgi:DNA-directed RNA polymerase delta subunit